MALMAQTRQHLQPPNNDSNPASSAVVTCAQLHVLADQIRALRQISIQLYCLKNPTSWVRRPSSSGAVIRAPSSKVPAKANGKKRLGRPSSSGTRKRRATPLKKEAAGRGKKARHLSDEEEEEEKEDLDSDVPETDEDIAARGVAASAPSRRPRRRRSSAINFKEADSDAEVDDMEAGAQFAEGPARLPKFRSIVLSNPKTDTDIHCDVCGDAEGGESNAIVLCDGDGCTTAVHQQCYGVEALPEGEWRCDVCTAGLDPAASHCLLCPVAGGALRSVASLGTTVPPEGQGLSLWVHSACALWVPEVTLQHPDTVSGVQLDGLTAASAAVECGLCHQKGGGVIQCAFGVCWRGFHVLCARNAGNRLALREDGAPLGFCALHSKERFARTRRELEVGSAAVDEPAVDAPEDDEGLAEPNEYELQRLRNIERNKQRLAELQQTGL